MAVICTDAGHGGEDSGASWKGVLEKDINLQIVKKLNQVLKQRGHTVYTTRISDTHVPPLSVRCQLINEHQRLSKPVFDLIISLHANVATRQTSRGAVPDTEQRGLYFIYNQESQAGTRLAEVLAQACRKQSIRLAHNGMLSTLELGRTLAWIHKTVPVSVLTEMGFMTNPTELERLLTVDYQDKIIQSIAEGIEQYVNA
jgi:N-acetylmuramoyl-L-alanine amidase